MPDGWTEVDPATWRKITLRMPNPDGSDDTIDLELLRSTEWIEDVGAESGKWIDFGLPEMGLFGKAQVVAIDECPAIEDGPGRVVLATVTHFNVEVLELKFEGLEKHVEPTARHRFFSEDRQSWIPAGELRAGELIRTRTGTARIESIHTKPGIHRVYNLEVETDHSYYVSGLELLSHNDNPCAAPRPSWVETEEFFERDLDEFGFGAQRSFKDGVEVPWGTKDSVRPDLISEYHQFSIDLKNYDLASRFQRHKLVQNIGKQVVKRAQHLPLGTRQGVIIDARGQTVAQKLLDRLVPRILRRTNGLVSPDYS